MQIKLTKKNREEKPRGLKKHDANTVRTSTLPHYHIKKCVEYLHTSKKSSTFAGKMAVESVFEYVRRYMLKHICKAYIGRRGRTNA